MLPTWWEAIEGKIRPLVTMENNLVNEDPKFVDADAGNFQLRDDSPAWKLGFQRIPVETIGLCHNDQRASWPVSHPACALPAPPALKLVFLGNSITLHGPNAKIGWSGNWGMAATAEEKDYVHLTARALGKARNATPVLTIRNIAEFERQYATYDAAAKLKDVYAFDADIVILAIGENVPALASDEAKTQFAAGLQKLLRGFKTARPPVVVVRSCFWPNQAKDQILKQACEEAGGIYVDIGALAKDEANYARSERKIAHAGVAAHPGNKGMQAIANALVEAIARSRQP